MTPVTTRFQGRIQGRIRSIPHIPLMAGTLLLIAGPRARAWALRANLRTDDFRATTSYSILKSGRIEFCVRYAAPGFDRDGIAAQARLAFAIWIRALQPGGKPVRVTVSEVSCASPTLNVMIDASSFQSRYLGYTMASGSAGRRFSYTNLSTAYRCQGARPNHAMIDFEALVGSRPALDHELELFEKSPWSCEAYAETRRLPLVRVECSTLPVLIHEIGHTFGLCDTYWGTPQKECDPELQGTGLHGPGPGPHGRDQPSSVMSGVYAFFLTPDDIEGVNQAFRFVRSRAIQDSGGHP